MQAGSTGTHLFSRQPLPITGKVTIGALLGAATSSGVLALTIGLPDNIALLIVTASLLLCAGIIATGLRWIPLLGTLSSCILLYQITLEPFVNFHLTHPQSGGFTAFVLDVLIIAFLVVTFVTGIGATIQNYRQGERHTSRWLTPVLTGVGGIVIGAILIGAISLQSMSTPTVSTHGEPTVHMGLSNFLQSSITIPKGSKLLLVDDGSFFHILANGSWENNTPRPAKEQGSPTVNNVQITGSSLEVGPFNTTGTYHIYCTVHQGMNLTIIVQ